MKLVSVYDVEEAPKVLYALLEERPWTTFISHERMPSYEQHVEFVESKPFRYWYLLRIHDLGEPRYVGALEVTDLNEIGISVLNRYQRKGYATAAMMIFLATHKPLSAIVAKRNPRWLANIAPTNADGKRFFEKRGFSQIQETWCL